MPDLASAVLWLARSLEVQFFPLEKENSYVDGNKYNSDIIFLFFFRCSKKINTPIA